LFEFQNVFYLNFNFGFKFKTAEKIFQKLFYFSGGSNSLEAWFIFPPSPAQLRPAHAAIWPNRPTRPFLHPLY
jgi:hypothetical protein